MSEGREPLPPARAGDKKVTGPRTANDLLDEFRVLLDVPMHVVVELGRTNMTVREILELDRGSIVQLPKSAGERVDIYVSGRLTAKGEVTVLDNLFAVRVSDLVATKERREE
ncbi:MAG: flagellar motor switch protein FliN [Candidatus Schekmanbacteria bacterium]|nr:flagellar motor switch protein FliN [Candidatus Schekmanbacteria bacterium]